MSVDELGFCHDCHTHVYDHPDIRCPNCGTGKVRPEVVGATDPVGALIDCRTTLSNLSQEIAAVKVRRRQLARTVLADPELVLEARRRRVRLASLDRWATPPAQKACRRGHATAEWGDWSGSRWTCRKCAEEGPPNPTRIAPNVPIAKRKDAARLAADWRKHEERLAERERLAALDQVPARLRPPMPPPTRPLP